MLTECGKTPFKSEVIVLSTFVLNKIIVLLVYRVIGEVHVFIVFIELGCIGLGSKSGQAFFVYIYSKRLVACHDHVDSEVKFIAVNEEGIGDVS